MLLKPTPGSDLPALIHHKALLILLIPGLEEGFWIEVVAQLLVVFHDPQYHFVESRFGKESDLQASAVLHAWILTL